MPKICILHTLHTTENLPITPRFLIHNPHYTTFTTNSFDKVLIMTRTALHATDQVLWWDHAYHPISPQNPYIFLEQPFDTARSRSFITQKKKICQHPLYKSCLSMQFYHLLCYFCGVGCLSQGKEGQREK